MWTKQLPGVKQVCVDFRYACACLNGFAMRGRECKRAMLQQQCCPPWTWAVPVSCHLSISVSYATEMLILGTARMTQAVWVRTSMNCCSVFISLHYYLLSYRITNPIWTDLNPSSWYHKPLPRWRRQSFSLNVRSLDGFEQNWHPLSWFVNISTLQWLIISVLPFADFSIISMQSIVLLNPYMSVETPSIAIRGKKRGRRVKGHNLIFIYYRK